MKKKCSLFVIFLALSVHFNVFGQQDSISAWQEQILSRLDPDDFSEAYFSSLMEMLGDLEIKNDTFQNRHRPISSSIIYRSTICLNTREGFRDRSPERVSKGKAYRGDPFRQTLRLKTQYGDDWKAGLTLDKEAGEPYRLRFPFSDSFTAYLAYKKTVIGHYRLRLGSGLILNQQFSLGKNLMAESFIHDGTRLSPHASTDDRNCFQGAATDLRFGHFRFIPFISYKKIDATIKNDTITSIPSDGLHRTLKEIRKRHVASVFNTGLHAGFRGEWFEVGANLLYTHFSQPFHRPMRTYNTFYFRGKELLQASMDFRAHRFGFDVRGEAAIDQDFHLAAIMQLRHSLGEDWRANLLIRHFDRKYQCLYAATVAESSAMQGEDGVMFAVNGSPFPHWQTNLIFDYFRFANIPYGFKKPFSGFDSRAQLSYSQRQLEATLTYRLKSKQAFRHSLDGIFLYNFRSGIKIKTQLRGKLVSRKDANGPAMGFAVAQAISYSPSDTSTENSRPLPNVECQFAWFDAEDYDTRLFLSEKQILYATTLPMLYGRGLRATTTITWKLSAKVSLDAKYSLVKYCDGRESISTDLQKINGSNQQNACLQLRMKF